MIEVVRLYLNREIAIGRSLVFGIYDIYVEMRMLTFRKGRKKPKMHREAVVCRLENCMDKFNYQILN